MTNPPQLPKPESKLKQPLWILFGIGVTLFSFAGGSTKSYTKMTTDPAPAVTQTTLLDDDNNSFDKMIDVAAALTVYHTYCAKLPADVKAMGEKIILLEPELVLAATVKKKREHEQVGNILWCAHWRNIFREVKEQQ